MATKSDIAEVLRSAVLDHPGNRLGEQRIYDEPIIGFASASDPMFTLLKDERIVGPLFRPPAEWIPDAATVVSYFLPFTEYIKASNRHEGLTSLEWLHARFRGEEFNIAAKALIVSLLSEHGYLAVAPPLTPEFHIDRKALRSNWSERHVAHIAGLGTFGLNAGLITERGMAGRLGSVVTNLVLDPTPRLYAHPYEYCPGVMDGTCGMCIHRCPRQAISQTGKNKQVCEWYMNVEDTVKDLRERFGYPYSSCGKCQVNIACESGIPGYK